ncbi:ferrous iron transporter B [Clostridia bacterium]|nr:ferrous iron transporter B [Clostridia bacterium]
MSVKFALAGNPNSGKTTLFNALTGSNQYVGNWPGVTVEKKSGRLSGKYRSGSDTAEIIDLPGIYSLSPYTAEEVVARNYLLDSPPDAVLNIIDGTNLERNLFLTSQLLELGIPVVILVNMMDDVDKAGDKINTAALGEAFGCAVVGVSALKGSGIDSAVKAAFNAIAEKRVPLCQTFSKEAETALSVISASASVDSRFLAVKILERDSGVMERLALASGKIDAVETAIAAFESAKDDDSASLITSERYAYIAATSASCLKKGKRIGGTLSDRIDRVVTNKYLALPIFAAVMFVIYYISITTVGAFLTDFVNETVFGVGGLPDILSEALTAVNCAEWLQGMLVDGIVAGVGAVLGFVPQIFLLFIFLAFLEGCGYMARIAFILDRVFRRFGLSGKSFIPMLIGTGCGVPGIMASRTIENTADKRMTVITTTFMPCSAKLPIIALISGAMFGGAWWVAPSAYFIGIASIIVSGIILKKTAPFRGETSPFVMELPTYRLPTVSKIARSTWERGFSFIRKAGSIILLAVIAVWFLSAYAVTDSGLVMIGAEDADEEITASDSMLAAIASPVSVIFEPLGWGDWRSTTAAITGLIAKENVVGTFGILYNEEIESEDGSEIFGVLAEAMTPLAAFSFLLFNLLCAPCFAAIGAIRREMNSGKWFAFAIGYQTVYAYVIALCVYQFGKVISGGVFSAGTAAAICAAAILVFMLVRKPRDKVNGLRQLTAVS